MTDRPTMPPTTPRPHVRRYVAWAAASLALTLLAGTWLRVATLYPVVLLGLEFRHVVHAHSHVALFGWTTMALFALVVEAAGLRGRWMRWHAALVGGASLAAFAGFLLVGYAPPTIAIATLHVLLWLWFAAAAWRPLDAAPPVPRRLLRGALALLATAGAGAMVPGVVAARGIEDPWLTALAVELFLGPFVQGWLGLGVAAALYARLSRSRFHAPVLWLMVAGALPSALFRVAAPAPLAWLPLVGRAATVATGVAALLLAADVLREPARRLPPLPRLAAAAAAVKGIAEIGVALVAPVALIASHQLVVAYLHLVLLGLVTPALLGTVVVERRVPRWTLLHAAGLLLTLAALAALGLAPLAARAAAAGVTARALLGAALAGGAASAVALLAVLAVLAPARGRAAS